MNVFKLIEDNGLTLHGDIEHFAELIRQEEREACAKVCDDIRYGGYVPPEDGAAATYYNDAANECAEAIRARGEQ